MAIYVVVCACVKLARSSIGDPEDIFKTHLIIIIKKRNYQPFPLLSYFLRGCVPEMVVPSYTVGFIYIPGKTVFFCYYCEVLWCVKMIEYILTRWSYSFVCTLHSLIIITMQRYLKVLDLRNICHVHSVECMSEIKSILSINFHGLCLFSLPISRMMWEYVCFILIPSSNRKYDPFAIV